MELIQSKDVRWYTAYSGGNGVETTANPAAATVNNCLWNVFKWNVNSTVWKQIDKIECTVYPQQGDYAIYVHTNPPNSQYPANGAIASYVNPSGTTPPAGGVKITMPTSTHTGTSGTVMIGVPKPSSLQKRYTNPVTWNIYGTRNASASTATAAPAQLGSAQTVTISKTGSYTGDLWHKVRITYGAGTSNEVTSGWISCGTSLTATYTIPSSDNSKMYALAGDGSSVLGKLELMTYADSGYATQIGSTYTILPSSTDPAPPKITIPSTPDTQPTATITTSCVTSGESYVQNISGQGVTITVTGTPQAGASISTIRITTPDVAQTFTMQNGARTATVVVDPLRVSGAYQINALVTDSRGYTGTATASITVTANPMPAFTRATVERCDSNGNITDEGTYAKYECTLVLSRYAAEQDSTIDPATVYANIGNGSRTLTLDATSKVVGATAVTCTYRGVFNEHLDSEQSYTAVFSCVDQISQRATITINLSTAIYTIYRMAGGKGVAFGMVADRMGVEVSPDWPFYVHNVEIFDLAHPVGSMIITGDHNFNPNTLYAWTQWARAEGVVTGVYSTTDERYPIFMWTRLI